MNDLSKSVAEEKLDNWAKCYSTELDKHFKKSNGSQFERLCSLELPDIKDVFPISAKDTSPVNFQIMMGLDSLTPIRDAFSFKPFLIFSSKIEPEKYFEFQYAENQPNITQASSKISYELFDWLTKNWREMDSELVDDVFEAKLDDNSMVRIGSLKRLVRKRLLGFYFTENINKVFWQFINDYRGNIQKISFHMGADMNKANHSEMFTFSPIFEVHFTKKDLAGNGREDIFYLHRLGLRSYELDSKTEVVYYEYMSPCPSSCPT